MFYRPIFQVLVRRLKEPRKFIQVLSGPRQSGKTTLIRQVIDSLEIQSHYASADEPFLQAQSWIEEQWNTARLMAKKSRNMLLVLDEIQKIPSWSDIVKNLWDEDTRNRIPLKTVILGSSPLLMQRGLSESLAGRFEIIPVSHWSYSEMRDAFGWELEQYIYFGGYPGAAPLIHDQQRWSRYIIDSLIETTISRDVLHMTRVDKPALLRRLFHLGCNYSTQVLSYQKMLGQLQDTANTTTLAHYLELLSGSGMVTGIQKFAGQQVRQRGSSPKLLALNTALISAQSPFSFEEAQENRSYWGRLVESSIGAYLVNGSIGSNIEVFYWREGNKEVDYILRRGKSVTAIEIKSGRVKDSFSGMDSFTTAFTPKQKIIVGIQGISIEEFLLAPVSDWV
jgi:hypothetical protein